MLKLLPNELQTNDFCKRLTSREAGTQSHGSSVGSFNKKNARLPNTYSAKDPRQSKKSALGLFFCQVKKKEKITMRDFFCKWFISNGFIVLKTICKINYSDELHLKEQFKCN